MRQVDRRWEREEQQMKLAWLKRQRKARARIRLFRRQMRQTPRRALNYLTRWALALP